MQVRLNLPNRVATARWTDKERLGLNLEKSGQKLDIKVCFKTESFLNKLKVTRVYYVSL